MAFWTMERASKKAGMGTLLIRISYSCVRIFACDTRVSSNRAIDVRKGINKKATIDIAIKEFLFEILKK